MGRTSLFDQSPADARLLLFSSLTLVLLGCAAVYWHGNEDLWNDEIYTLQNFVFKGLPTILTDYHAPNNHIFANVLHWAWASLTGADFGDCLDAPWRIRLLPGLLSVLTVWVLVKTATRHWGAEAGFTAGLILLTGISFQAFAFQVRGYPLSLLAASGLLYFALRVIEEGSFSWKNRLTVVSLTAALLWAIPSNLYFVLVVALLTPGAALLDPKINHPQGERLIHLRPVLWFAAAIVAGVVLAMVLYAPVLWQVLHNKYVEAGKSFQPAHWENSEKTLRHFLSWRWLLLPGLIWGWYRILKNNTEHRPALVLLSGTLFLPFLISAARGDSAPMRSYLVQLPAFVLLTTVTCVVALQDLNARWRRWSVLILFFICGSGYAYAVYELRQRLAEGLHDGWRYQDLNYNYYQHFYAPNKEFDLFQKKFPHKILIVENSEPHDIPVFVRHRAIASAPIDSMLRLARPGDTLFFSTRDGQRLIEGMQKDWDCSCMQPALRYPRVVVCRKK